MPVVQTPVTNERTEAFASACKKESFIQGLQQFGSDDWYRSPVAQLRV